MRELAREADISLGLASMATSPWPRKGWWPEPRGLELFDPAGLWMPGRSTMTSAAALSHLPRRSSVAQMEERLARQAQHLGEQYP
jgi:hypothetical protein